MKFNINDIKFIEKEAKIELPEIATVVFMPNECFFVENLKTFENLNAKDTYFAYYSKELICNDKNGASFSYDSSDTETLWEIVDIICENDKFDVELKNSEDDVVQMTLF